MDLDNNGKTTLDDDDVVCGKVFYSAHSLFLKFICTYCHCTYDNIEIFCQHLSQHINAGEPDETGFIKCEEGFENLNISQCAGNTSECHVDDLIIEDVEENCDIIEFSHPKDFVGYGSSKSFEECFLKETNIEKIRSEGVCVLNEDKPPNKPAQKKKPITPDLLRLKRKRKKVTTVKVIAVKNRIAELYDRIRKQQDTSQQIITPNTFLESVNVANIEQETQDALESMPKNENELDPDSFLKDAKLAKEPSHQIRGETLITLITEADKSAPAFPSVVENIARKPSFNVRLVKPEKLENDKKAVCPACGKSFRSYFSLTIHKRIHYLESDSLVKLAHKCSDCDQLFNKLSQLKQHVETTHYPDGFVCKICNRRLSSLSLLERHMIKVHLDRPFNCQQCGKNFSDPITYEEHLISHNSGEIYKCQICGRKYSTEFFLVEHLRNHKEQIPQTCVVCGKVTLRIKQHMKIHTPRPKRLLSCSVCGKVFNFSSGLSHHFKIMHKLPRPPPKPKKEQNLNASKRKRRPRNTDRANKKKEVFNTSSATSYNISGQVIEEPSEIPMVDEIYDDAQTNLHLATDQLHQSGHDHEEEDVHHKEEEAKRVIVELIQNSTYSALFPDNLSSVLEVTPPIAREEEISAVNSIVDC